MSDIQEKISYKELEKTPNFARWVSMRRRCHYPKDDGYKWYGARGIEVCEEWRRGRQGFMNYTEYISSLPNAFKPGYTVDRINNDGNYEPGNLRWATDSEQNLNKGLHGKNTSGVTGVSYNQRGYYRAYLTVNGELVHNTHHRSFEEAVKARRFAEDRIQALKEGK